MKQRLSVRPGCRRLHTAARQTPTQRGFTLVELLVVIAVLIAVTAILVPSVRFVFKDRKIRESVRTVDSYIVASQTNALNSGMSGLWIERDQNTPNTSTRIYHIKSPSIYAGDFQNATCQLVATSEQQINDNGNMSPEKRFPNNNIRPIDGIDNDNPPNGFIDDRFWGVVQFNNVTGGLTYLPGFLKIGSLIQFDLKSAWYVITNVNAQQGQIRVGHEYLPVPRLGTITKFRVLRVPERQSTSYLDLPKNTMIDLSKSGLTVVDVNNNGLGDDPGFQGDEFAFPANVPNIVPEPIIIVFGDDGSVEVIYIQGRPLMPDRSLHLFLVNDERDDSTDLNLATFNQSTETLENLSNFWVTINRQGAVATAENADTSAISDPGFLGEWLRSARRLTRQMQTTSGG